MKGLVFSLLSIFFLADCLTAQIIKTSSIQDIREEITDNTLVLFNIAEVLMDTETSLGTQAWRKFIRVRLDSKLHDELTLFVFENVPPKCPEPSTPQLINELQSEGIVTLAFTSRGRNEWYASQVPNVDLITEKLLLQIGIDFSKTQLSEELLLLPSLFAEFYHAGVIYATNTREKGELLLEIFERTGYRPSKIVFVDDKVDSLIAVEKTPSSLNIPFVGYAYSRTSKDHANFDPLVANIQLDWLITYGKVLTDAEAIEIKNEQYLNTDLSQYFEEVIGKWKAYQGSIAENSIKSFSKTRRFSERVPEFSLHLLLHAPQSLLRHGMQSHRYSHHIFCEELSL